MGQLVFQATAGGQVALVGPNPATNFSLNVPAVNGNLVTTGDTGTVTNTMISGPINATNGGTGVAGTLTGILYGNGTSAHTVATTAQALSLIGTVPVANGGTGSTTSTGSGSVVLQTSPSITTPTIDKINTSVTNTSLGAGNASIMKNRIINGAMGIAQRGTSTSITSNGQFCSVDRFRTYTNGTWGTGTFTATQSSAAPTGFSNSLGITITATDALSTSTASYIIGQTIEGNNTYDLGYGTANAKTVTLSFWVQSSLTGTFGGVIQNNAGNYSYPFSYTISSANTWTQISVTIAGPTTGTWLTGTFGSIYVYWSLGANSSLLAAAGSWTSTANISGATGQTNIISTNGATFYITGVQLEVGSSATGFEYRQYQQELALCQRYYWRNNDPTATSTFIPCGNGYTFNTTTGTFQLSFPVTMRTRVATINFSNVRVFGASNGSAGVVTSVSGIQSTNTVFQADVAASSATFIAGTPAALQGNNNTAAYAEFSAEL